MAKNCKGETSIELRESMTKPVWAREKRPVLAGHYGFTAAELDFILNYDLKYRLGRDTEGEICYRGAD